MPLRVHINIHPPVVFGFVLHAADSNQDVVAGYRDSRQTGTRNDAGDLVAREAVFASAPVRWYVPIHAFTFRGATLSKKDEQIAGEKTSFLSMRAEGKDWFGPPFVSLTCDIPAAGRYSVSIKAVKGPGQAQIQLFEDEAPVGDAIDMYTPERQRSELTRLGDLVLEEGPVNLMLKLVGMNEKSEGLGFDLITIQCDRIE